MNKPRPLSFQAVVATGVVALAASAALAFSRPATLEVDGQQVRSDVPPVTTPQHAYLPLRAVTAALGAQVHYNSKTRSILVVHGPDRLKLLPGVRSAVYNGRPIQLSHPVFTVRGRTMIAARTVERILGPKVRYDARRSTINVFTTDTSVAAERDDNSSSEAF